MDPIPRCSKICSQILAHYVCMFEGLRYTEGIRKMHWMATKICACHRSLGWTIKNSQSDNDNAQYTMCNFSHCYKRWNDVIHIVSTLAWSCWRDNGFSMQSIDTNNLNQRINSTISAKSSKFVQKPSSVSARYNWHCFKKKNISNINEEKRDMKLFEVDIWNFDGCRLKMVIWFWYE